MKPWVNDGGMEMKNERTRQREKIGENDNSKNDHIEEAGTIQMTYIYIQE